MSCAGLHLLNMLEIGGVGARDSRSSGLVHHVDNYALVPRLRYRIRIRSPLKSMV